MHQFFQIFIVAFPTLMILSTRNSKGILTELGAKLMSSSKRMKLLPLIHAKELYQLTCPS